jgi:hypothetical protein
MNKIKAFTIQGSGGTHGVYAAVTDDDTLNCGIIREGNGVSSTGRQTIRTIDDPVRPFAGNIIPHQFLSSVTVSRL